MGQGDGGHFIDSSFIPVISRTGGAGPPGRADLGARRRAGSVREEGPVGITANLCSNIRAAVIDKCCNHTAPLKIHKKSRAKTCDG